MNTATQGAECKTEGNWQATSGGLPTVVCLRGPASRSLQSSKDRAIIWELSHLEKENP